MAKSVIRRPLPALVALLSLLLLTGIVWWRVMNRDSNGPSDSSGPSCPGTSAPAPESSAALPAPSAVTLQVVNSSSRNGIASKVRRTLQQEGFRIPKEASNDPSKDKKKNVGVGQIRFGPAGQRSAALVHYYLPGATMVSTSSKTTTVIVALGPKYKQIANAETVTRAIRKDNKTVVTPAPSTPGGTPSVSC